MVLEGALDSFRLRQMPVLEPERTDRQIFGGADRLPGHVQLFPDRGQTLAGGTRFPDDRRDGGPHFSVFYSRIRATPVSGSLVLSMDAARAFPGAGTCIRMAFVPHGKG